MKSLSSKTRSKTLECGGSTPPSRVGGSTPSRARQAARRQGAVKPAHSISRAEYRAWRGSLPTPLERDTLLWPEVIAESVVAEASRYLNAELPANFPARLAAKAYHLYPRHRHFHKMLNRPGNRGRHNLYVYMRHWTASWLKRERWSLFKRLPWEYALGRQLPSSGQ
jgi:hypothetical protein